MKNIITKMKGVGTVQVIVFSVPNSEKFFLTNMIDWELKRVIDRYLRR